MTKIEEVAAAIHAAGEGCLSGAVYIDPTQAALAAVAAMRVPNGFMISKVHATFDEVEAYAELIDAAIAEHNK